MPEAHASPAVAAELRRLLVEAGVTQYRLREEAGLSAETARILLGLRDGLPSLGAADRALALLDRELWHRKRRAP